MIVGLVSAVSTTTGRTMFAGQVVGPVASNVWSIGAVIVGAVVSLTVTVKDAVPTLFARSVEEHETTVVPSGKTVPDAGAQVALRPESTSSVTVGAG